MVLSLPIHASNHAPVQAAGAAAPADAGQLGRETLADRLAERLSAQIQRGTLAPGDRLPTEAQLAATHGVSRSVVREAVHRIKSRGLLVSRQGSGVFVSAPAQHQALEFDPAVLESVEAVVQVVEVRRVLEGEIAALAAERATRAQLTALKQALAAIDAASAAGHDGVAEDLAFHRAIGEATGNPQFRSLLGFLEQYLREGMRITRGNEARRLDFMEAVRKEHRAIVDAIVARDPAAARRAALRHLQHSQRRLEQGGVLPNRAAAKPVGATPRPSKRPPP
ncbi:FadR/GntR family transcriptional regulator [Aquabacterium sp.]|uniref:FadR/GntR family transcriptional regulator n=1 Tax=Aquabacterium sp. TaxID=1872578 RepID=UPI002C94CA01|nr:FadR/GntR family transcriptional regulator [Aquabacterium sp.]HSW07654.1 FadR/GntR family transcriptional regulator [Aquabacterium sp.]